MGSELLNKEQASRMLGVEPEIVDQLRKSGKLGFIRLGHKTIRFELSELNRFLNDNRIAAKRRSYYGYTPASV
jgi:excisionase family DNA binding protein